jgi:hypothetical protein
MYFCVNNIPAMKNFFLFSAIIVTVILAVLSGCKSEPAATPCDNKGTVYFLNKLDTSMVVSITETHSTFTVHKDENKSILFDGNTAYNINVSSVNYQKDTLLFVLPCDNLLLKISQ